MCVCVHALSSFITGVVGCFSLFCLTVCLFLFVFCGFFFFFFSFLYFCPVGCVCFPIPTECVTYPIKPTEHSL